MIEPRFVLATPPASEPVSAEDAARQLRVDEESSAEYGAIEAKIKAAREDAEAYTGRAFVTQTWEAVLDAFPTDGVIPLAKGDLQSVTSVKYLDAAGVEQTLSSALYQVDSTIRDGETGGRVVLAPNASWPATSDKVNAVRVRFVAGYGDPAAVPEKVKQAILLMVGDLYAHRESEITGTIVSRFTLTAERLLNSVKLGWM